jgi:hypothetical protein
MDTDAKRTKQKRGMSNAELPKMCGWKLHQATESDVQTADCGKIQNNRS